MIKIEITKELCKKEIVSEIISRISLAIVFGVIAFIGVALKEFDTTWFIVTLITVILMLSSGVIYLLLKKSAVLKNEFHIVEDVLIHVFENSRQRSTKGQTSYNYCARFSKNGEYKIAFHSKDGFGVPSGDYGIVRNSEPGDKIYLVMSNKNKILQCYNAKDYTISEDDFELRDGKYYLWGSKMADPVE